MTPTSSEAAGDAIGGGAHPDLAVPDPPLSESTPSDTDGIAPADVLATDGRVARGQRTRRNVAEALMELLRAGDPDPTAKAVAEQAGVSLRLVFHHFADMDELYQFVASLQLRRSWSDLPQRSPALARQKRIEWTVAHRAGLFEEISPIRRALVRRTAASPGVRDAVAAADALLLENLKATFAPELGPLPVATRIETLDAMDTATSWEAWERLRSTSGVRVREARRVVARMLASLCPIVSDATEKDGASASTPSTASAAGA